jgi:hypothetical protein
MLVHKVSTKTGLTPNALAISMPTSISKPIKLN